MTNVTCLTHLGAGINDLQDLAREHPAKYPLLANDPLSSDLDALAGALQGAYSDGHENRPIHIPPEFAALGMPGIVYGYLQESKTGIRGPLTRLIWDRWLAGDENAPLY